MLKCLAVGGLVKLAERLLSGSEIAVRPALAAGQAATGSAGRFRFHLLVVEFSGDGNLMLQAEVLKIRGHCGAGRALRTTGP